MYLKKSVERLKVTYFSIFVFALIFRIWNLDVDPYGDEAWHLFLTRTLGFGKDLESVPSHPPLLYFLYFPFSGSLRTFRIINILVGSSIPVIIYAILLNYKVKKSHALGGALLASIHPLLVIFSSLVFYEILATFFSLLALLCTQKTIYKLSAIFVSLATLTKEYYALFGFGLLLASVIEEKRLLSKRSITYIIALIPIIIWYWIIFGFKPFPSMSVTPMSLKGWNSLFLSIWFIPLYCLLLWLKKYSEFLLLFIYPTFLVVWHYGFAAGVDNWYLILPSALSIIFFFLTINQLESKIHAKLKTDHLLSKAVQVFPLILLVFTSYTILPQTYSFITEFHEKSLIMTIEYIKANYPNQRLLVIDVYWGYKHYPLSEVAIEVEDEYTHGSSDNILYYVDRIYSYDLTIVYKTLNSLNSQLRTKFLNSTIYETVHYTLIKP